MFISYAYILQQIVNGLAIGMSYALIAVGLNLVFGILRLVNFAHGQFYMLGAYLAYTFAAKLGANYFLAIILAVLLTYAIGLLCNRLVVRPLQGKEAVILMVATLGLGVILENAALLVWGATPRTIPSPYASVSVSWGDITLIQQRVLNFIIGAAILVFLWLFIIRTKVGKLMRATSQNFLGAALLGVNISRISNFTFAFSCSLAACAGAFVASTSTIFPHIGGMALIKAFVVVILGGMGSLGGAIVAGLLLGVAENVGGAITAAQYQDFIGYIAIVIILLFKPSGLFGDPKAL